MRGVLRIAGSALLVVAAVVFGWWLLRPAERRNILFVTVDTLRADRLGCYGYERKTSPTLDALAARGVLFENAFTQATLSGPSHASIFTGLEVPDHGVFGNAVELADEHVTLTEILRAAGYESVSLVGHPLVGEEFGFDQGFELFETITVDSHRHGHGDAETDPTDQARLLPLAFDRAVEWLAGPHTRPFFFWFHVQNVHESYEPPPPFDAAFATPIASEYDLRCSKTYHRQQDGEITLSTAEREHISALYDGEVAWADQQLGRLFAALDESGLVDRTIVVVTADHGEMLFADPERRIVGHGRERRDVVLRVPLILAGPGLARGLRIPGMAGTIDLAPTILDYAGVRSPQSFAGQSLRGAAAGRPYAGREMHRSMTFHTDGVVRMAARTARFKLICDRYDSKLDCQGFDLARDPQEQSNLVAHPDYRETVSELRDALEGWFTSVTVGDRLIEVQAPDRRALQLLRRAGYLPEERTR